MNPGSLILYKQLKQLFKLSKMNAISLILISSVTIC